MADSDPICCLQVLVSVFSGESVMVIDMPKLCVLSVIMAICSVCSRTNRIQYNGLLLWVSCARTDDLILNTVKPVLSGHLKYTK